MPIIYIYLLIRGSIISFSNAINPIHTVDIQSISDEKLSEFQALTGRPLSQNQMLQDMIVILKTADSNIEHFKVQFNELKEYMDTLNDKDLSDWLSKTGLGLFEKLLENKKENNKYYSAALVWLEKRFDSSGELIDDFNSYHRLITTFKNKIKNKISLISENIENIRDENDDKMDKIKAYIREIGKLFNHNYSSLVIDMIVLRN